MLRITLEPQTQINLFSKPKSAGLYYELEVVNKGAHAEVKLYYLANDKSAKKQKGKRGTPAEIKTIEFQKISKQLLPSFDIVFKPAISALR